MPNPCLAAVLDALKEAGIRRPSIAVGGRHVQVRWETPDTNFKDVLPNTDGRSHSRFRDIASQIATDQGGIRQPSEARLQLVRRFAACAVLADGGQARARRLFDIQEHATLCSTLVRLGSRIGIDRHPRDVTPDLQAYLQRKEADEFDEEADE